MLTLELLQKKFARGLNNEDKQIIQHIQPTKRLSAEQHFAIHQENIAALLQDVLCEVFPVCCKLIGKILFINLCNRYIRITQSRSANLANYGEYFASFIETVSTLRTEPYLADLAHLEWAWHRIFEMASAKKIDMEELSIAIAVRKGKILFHLPDNSFLLHSQYPIHEIWEQVNAVNLPLELSNHYFIVWRHQTEMRLDSLSATEWQVLSWFREGLSLATVSKMLNIQHKARISQLLPHLIQNGWVADFS